MTIQEAIERSVSHTEIVTIDGGREECDALAARCDDSVEASYDRGPGQRPGTLIEYWGTDADGDEWRVHVRYQAS